MLATRRLSSDHKAFLKLLDKLEGAAAVPGRHADAVLLKTLRLLLPPLALHARLEEEILYPLLDERMRPGKPAGATLAQEHAELSALAGRLETALAADAAEARAGILDFCALLRKHIYLEDHMAFPLAERLLGDAVLETASDRMSARVRRAS
jgi:hemerythrin-like domain-containing protein